MKISRTFSIDAQLFSEITEHLDDPREERDLNEFANDALLNELRRSKREIVKKEGD